MEPLLHIEPLRLVSKASSLQLLISTSEMCPLLLLSLSSYTSFVQKLMGIMTAVLDKIGFNAVFKGKANRLVLAFLLLLIKAAILILLKLILH